MPRTPNRHERYLFALSRMLRACLMPRRRPSRAYARIYRTVMQMAGRAPLPHHRPTLTDMLEMITADAASALGQERGRIVAMSTAMALTREEADRVARKVDYPTDQMELVESILGGRNPLDRVLDEDSAGVPGLAAAACIPLESLAQRHKNYSSWDYDVRHAETEAIWEGFWESFGEMLDLRRDGDMDGVRDSVVMDQAYARSDAANPSGEPVWWRVTAQGTTAGRTIELVYDALAPYPLDAASEAARSWTDAGMTLGDVLVRRRD
ncbi:MAG: hypothetical protein VKP62_16730 [Candidatus Sericytochromatia bacterium]|nr:hypothetical protein [Candidatus Sericytochromatia bacterium]